MAEFNVAYQRNDIVLKRLTATLEEGFLRRLGLSFPPIVAALPTELPTLTVQMEELDMLFRLADGSLLHPEFQSTTQAADLRRFATYNLAAHEKYRCPVWTVVIYGAGIERAADTLEAGSLTFRVHTVFLGREDGTATLQDLHAKVLRGEPLTAEDRVSLALWPLMRQSTPLQESASDVRAIVLGLPEEQRTETVAALAALALRFAGEEWTGRLLEVLNMPNMLEEMIDEAILRGLAEGRAEGEAKGRTEGRTEGVRATLRKILQSHFGAIPDALEQRISSADLEILDTLTTQALEAQSLEDLL